MDSTASERKEDTAAMATQGSTTNVRINQSIFDESQITEDQPSFIADLKDASAPPRDNKTGKFTPSDLIPDQQRQGQGDPYDKSDLMQPELKQGLLDKDRGGMQMEDQGEEEEDMSFGSKKSIEAMSAAHTEVLSVQVNKERFEMLDKLRTYLAFTCLIAISISSLMQKAAISYMYSYQHPVEDFVDGNASEAADFRAHENPHYNIRDDIDSLTPENFGYMAGDFFTVLYAFMVLFTGSASDLFNRKKLLLWTCFGWCICTYLSSFAQDFTQLMVLRVLVGFFNAVSGPCSYSLITDWFPPESRTLAYSIYAFGAQFGGPVSTLNTELIAWLGWRAAFQFLALSGFVILGISILCFDEPERGRFDINHSVINNPEDSIANNTMAYRLSEESTRKRLNVQREAPPSQTFQSVQEYCLAVRELFVNDTANWILLASCLRTQQSIAMGQFTQAFFLVYPGKDDLFNLMSTVAGLVGSFICTMGTGIICDRYDNYNYMTKAYICVGTTLVSIPCCCMIYLCTTNFWISISGLFIEYLLSTGWGQPAIGILATVVDPGVRGTAVSVFFFFITIFGVIAPQGYSAIQTYYGLDPIEEPTEFGIFICLCTVIPCIVAVPCFYIAGVKYSWFKYHEAMFMLDVWNEMEQWYQEDISKKRWYQAQLNGGPDPADAANLSVSVDWKVLREQRKIKVKNLKKQNLDLRDVKPTLKKRAGLVGAHGQMVKKKTIVANFQEDETPSDFPDTRSYAEHEESFRFDKYAQSWDGRRQYFQE